MHNNRLVLAALSLALLLLGCGGGGLSLTEYVDQINAAAEPAAGWEALSESSEMAAYRDALADGKQGCTDFQSELDATEARRAFAETPWVPGELAVGSKRV